jgi:hypothetical protein
MMKQSIMAVGTCGRGYSLHGRQEGVGERRKRRRMKKIRKAKDRCHQNNW